MASTSATKKSATPTTDQLIISSPLKTKKQGKHKKSLYLEKEEVYRHFRKVGRRTGPKAEEKKKTMSNRTR